MRAILLALMLVSAPIHASYLEVHYECGKPKHLIGFIDGQYVSEKWRDIVANSALLDFFDKVIAQLPVVNGKKQMRQVEDDLPPGYTCPVSA